MIIRPGQRLLIPGLQVLAPRTVASEFPPWSANENNWSQFQNALQQLGGSQTDTATTFGSLSGIGKWYGGVLAPNGCIYGIPRDSTTVLKILSTYMIDGDFPLSRFVNKF